MGKGVHMFSGLSAAVVMMLCVAMLSDGHSVMNMKEKDQVIQTVAGPVQLHSLMGYPYGFGATSDQYGNKWGDKRNPTDHPAHFVSALSCPEHIQFGNGLRTSFYVALFFAIALLVSSFAGVHSPTRNSTMISIKISALLVVALVASFVLAAKLYTGSFYCAMFQYPITLRNYFDLGPITIAHAVSTSLSLTSFVVQCFALKDDEPAHDDDQIVIKMDPLEDA
eukprot:TRINITY_DN902_c0_g1_i1.p1 TRINITY_DN902_c0_g1~~TRINITY_DN902_c0_g1_i1.p1  ORF type:complete len:223 (+),score=40.48 TRINITY_DN902_c0_g1_i1:73-741(+)